VLVSEENKGISGSCVPKSDRGRVAAKIRNEVFALLEREALKKRTTVGFRRDLVSLIDKRVVGDPVRKKAEKPAKATVTVGTYISPEKLSKTQSSKSQKEASQTQ